MEKEVVIDLEQDVDGVYKPTTVRRVRKKKEVDNEQDTEVMDFVPQELRNSKEPPVEELLRGFDAGMRIFNRLARAMREGK